MMIKTIFFVAVELAVFYFLVGHYLIRKIMPTRRRQWLALRDYEHHLRRILRIDGDLLDVKTCTDISRLADHSHALRQKITASTATSDLATEINSVETKCHILLAYRATRFGWLRESLEIMVVALSVAFGFRALFLQPFKIPTGSMQPTLYGIEFHDGDDSMRIPDPVRRFTEFIHFSRRYVDNTVQRSGTLQDIRIKRRFPFLSTTQVVIAGITYSFPGDLDALRKINPKIGEFLDGISRNPTLSERFEPPYFQSGERLAKGYLTSGDHVFVNRFLTNFTDVKRGDIVVFLTDGIHDRYGNPLNGRFYIKRLVGMPGDTLVIRDDNRLYVRQQGDSEFRIVDGSMAPAFNRIYSDRGGYHGYVKDMPGTAWLNTPYTLDKDEYIMLGDNSARSQDSRFWGPVPRRNIIGRASLAWWPLSRRWGITDTAEPEDFITPQRADSHHNATVK